MTNEEAAKELMMAYEDLKHMCYMDCGREAAFNKACENLKAEPCEDAVKRESVLNTLDTMDKALDENRTVEDYKELLKECYKELLPVTPKQRWIPVSEKLPNDRDWYLGIFKEPDTGWVNLLPFICDYVGRETKATTKEYWILRGFTDIDEHIDYYFNLECVAWMPLPAPYKKGESE